MQRYFIELTYNGTGFFGWQIQPNEISVQEVIEAALSKVHSNSTIKVVGCGRTDSGVHAHHFMLHVDLPTILNEEKFIYKLNKILPNSITITNVSKVSNDKHARFDATNRTYRYYINTSKDPFKEKQSWYLSKELDIDQMNIASKFLLGTQDFTSLSKLHTDVNTNICDVRKAEWIVVDSNTIYFEISADRFLRNMVRATVGTLIDVGTGKIKAKDIKLILEAKDRQAASTSVPAHGLYLWKVEYD